MLWVLLLLTIPFTSHPWVTRLFGWSTVSPLSALPLIVLAVIWLPQYWAKTRSLPRVSMPLVGFVAAVMLSSAAAYFLPLYPQYDTSVPARELRSLITLGVGVTFYLVAATWPKSEAEVRNTLRWISLGGILLLAYATFQILTLPQADDPVQETLVKIHRLFSIRDPLRTRVTGFAYEPSWLGNQLVILYLPLWLGSAVAGRSFLAAGKRRPTLEIGLLIWGSVVLFFSFARLSWISFILVVAVLSVAGPLWLAERGRRGDNKSHDPLAGMNLRRWAALLAGAIFVLGVAMALLLGATALDERLENVFATDLAEVFNGRHPWPYQLANELKFAERLMYWTSGLMIFSEYPLLGVGLGNAGFRIPSTVPAFGFFLPEIVNAIRLGAFGFPNVKSLWFRLLAETGIVGFGFFMAWLGILGASAFRRARNAKGLPLAIALAALFALLAQVTEGLSLDTFALPQLWIIMGLLTASLRLPDRSSMINSSGPEFTAARFDPP